MPPALITIGETLRLTGLSRGDAMRRFRWQRVGKHYYALRRDVIEFVETFQPVALTRRRAIPIPGPARGGWSAARNCLRRLLRGQAGPVNQYPRAFRGLGLAPCRGKRGARIAS